MADRLDQAVEAMRTAHYQRQAEGKSLPSRAYFRGLLEAALPFLRSPADEPSEEEVEAAAKAAFWEDDLGGHIKGRWTWDTIPDEGRENYRQMIRAALRAAAESREAQRA